MSNEYRSSRSSSLPLRNSAKCGQQDNGMVSISHDAPMADVGGDDPRTDVAGTSLGTMTSTSEMQRESETVDETAADSLGDAMHAPDATAASKETKYDPETEAILDLYALPRPKTQSSLATTAQGTKTKVDLQPLTSYKPEQAFLMYTTSPSGSESAPLAPKGSKFLGTEVTIGQSPTTSLSPQRDRPIRSRRVRHRRIRLRPVMSSDDISRRIKQSTQAAKNKRDDPETEADLSLSDALREVAPDQEAGQPLTLPEEEEKGKGIP